MQHEKSCKIKKDGSPEVADNGKIFNSNNSGEFVLPPSTGNWHQNSL